MVYGEKLNTFDESRKDLLEFQNAAIAFFELLFTLQIGPPLYKYFPTKTYRRFVQAITRIHEYGMFLFMFVSTVHCARSLQCCSCVTHTVIKL